MKPGAAVDLNAMDAKATRGWTKSRARAQTRRNLARIAELQELMFVEKKRGLLIVLQAMDTGGKDGTVRTLGGAMNPAGARVVAFKKPTAEEKAHDFLWRIRKHLPKAGEMVIFNRSHYEDVGIARVHALAPEKELDARYAEINVFEDALAQPTAEVPEGTRVLKFFLHISKKEQLARFRDRLDDPAKQWKLSAADFEERQYWDGYMKAYSRALSECATEEAPWFVVPADNKWMRDLIVTQVVVDYLEGLSMKPPAPTVDVDAIRRKYFNARAGKPSVPQKTPLPKTPPRSGPGPK